MSTFQKRLRAGLCRMCGVITVLQVFTSRTFSTLCCRVSRHMLGLLRTGLYSQSNAYHADVYTKVKSRELVTIDGWELSLSNYLSLTYTWIHNLFSKSKIPFIDLSFPLHARLFWKLAFEFQAINVYFFNEFQNKSARKGDPWIVDEFLVNGKAWLISMDIP